jgi:hypothetical protein
MMLKVLSNANKDMDTVRDMETDRDMDRETDRGRETDRDTRSYNPYITIKPTLKSTFRANFVNVSPNDRSIW